MPTPKQFKDPLEELNYERFSSHSPTVQKRLHAVYLHQALWLTPSQIGLCVDLHLNSVRHWIKVYQQQGIAPLLQTHYGTNQSELESYNELILADFARQPPQSSNQASARIQTLTGLKRSPSQVRNYLKKQGFTFQRMGHIPAKADPIAQQEWIENKFEPALKDAQQRKSL